MDETSAVVDPSRKRVINTEKIRYSSKGSARRINLFGFMALNGKDVAMASGKAKAVDFASFLEAVRDANGDRTIAMILDNAMVHRSALAREAAEELNIKLVFLPPYSPDLNPIEFSWKDLKRELASVLDFDLLVDASGPTALSLFRTRKMSYSAHWRKVFLCDIR